MEDNLVLDWKFNRIPNNASGYIGDGGKVVAYINVSDDFAKALDNLFDDGCALITNTIKDLNMSYIENVNRNDTFVTVSFVNDINVWKSLDNDLAEKLNALFDLIDARSAIGQYSSDIPANEYFPIYTSGNVYKPDGMAGMISEVCIAHIKKKQESVYLITFYDNGIFENMVSKYDKYFYYVFKDIFKCDALIRCNTHDIIIIDKADANVDKANALGCAVMHTVLQIIDILKLKENME